jgi:hypothetical protein
MERDHRDWNQQTKACELLGNVENEEKCIVKVEKWINSGNLNNSLGKVLNSGESSISR